MADFCRKFDEGLWEKENINITILCEGHGGYEDLDSNGFPLNFRQAFPASLIYRISRRFKFWCR